MKSQPDKNRYWCSGCKQLFSKEAFYKSSSRSTGVASACKKCSIACASDWNKKNRERHNLSLVKYKATKKAQETGKVWQERNRARLTEYMRQWRNNNPDKVKANSAVSRNNNLQKILVRNREREIAEIQAIPQWADKEKIMLIYLTAKDMSAKQKIKYHVDHIVPLRGKNVCGLHVESNLQILSAKENLRKHNRFEEAPL